MKLTVEQKRRIDLAIERLLEKCHTIKQQRSVPLGIAAAPRPEGYVEDDPLLSPIDTAWVQDIEPENSALNQILLEYLATAPKPDQASLPKLDETNLWVWGGPTPYWGGTMAEDTLVKGADYFNAKNVVYVYGATNDKMMSLHAKYHKMLCQINDNCRTPGAQEGSTNEENAERLSKLSLQYPNIVGAMCDDAVVSYHKIVLPERFESRYTALKKFNPTLKMYCTVYVHDLQKDFSMIQPYIDTVNFWLWSKNEILEYDEHIARCQEKFPGKPILQGIFLHEYGTADAGNVPELLCYQMDKAREYMAKGVVEGVVILGDREIKKWPDVAATVKNYLLNQ